MAKEIKINEEKFKKNVTKILSDLKELNKELEETGFEIGETSEDVEEIKEDVEKIKKEMGETGDEIEDIGEDVEDIKGDVEEIKKEVDETGEEIEDIGEDVDEIKGDVEEIKKDIGDIKKATLKGKLISKVTKALPEKFEFDDIAQQIVGATILSAPFAVTEEVWGLSRNLTLTNLTLIIFITIAFDFLLFYFTKYQKIEDKRIFNFPLRIISLILVTYITSAIVLTVFGVIGGEVQETIWAAKLVVMVGLFANIGAGTADLIK